MSSEEEEKRDRGAARSLLQKAVRRGASLVVEQAARYLLLRGDRAWLRSRTVVIVFEECWPLASGLVLPRDPEELIRLLTRISLTKKHKCAAGLGALANDYQGGARGMLSFIEDQLELKIVSSALARPPKFFEWAKKVARGQDALAVIEFAEKHLSSASWPWDKACVLAGAFLAATGGVPELEPATAFSGDFPYWVGLDKHTEIGRNAMLALCSRSGIDYNKLAASCFYLEGAKTNEAPESLWFDADAEWSLSKAGLSVGAARSFWDSTKPSLVAALSEPEARLRSQMVATAKAPKQLSLLG